MAQCPTTPVSGMVGQEQQTSARMSTADQPALTCKGRGHSTRSSRRLTRPFCTAAARHTWVANARPPDAHDIDAAPRSTGSRAIKCCLAAQGKPICITVRISFAAVASAKAALLGISAQAIAHIPISTEVVCLHNHTHSSSDGQVSAVEKVYRRALLKGSMWCARVPHGLHDVTYLNHP